MSMRAKGRPRRLSPETIDDVVTLQAGDDSAWDAAVRVRHPRVASVSIPGDLAARAAFLAKLHREPRVDKWVERIVRDRVELEELAFAEAKKRLAP
jgi:hypothetical protein